MIGGERDPEYLEYARRNHAVSNAYGIVSSVKYISERMAKRNDCPKWLLDSLGYVLVMAQAQIEPLKAYRDQLAHVKTIRTRADQDGHHPRMGDELVLPPRQEFRD